MNEKLPVIKIFKESLRLILTNFGTIFKLSIAPLATLAILFIFMMIIVALIVADGFSGGLPFSILLLIFLAFIPTLFIVASWQMNLIQWRLSSEVSFWPKVSFQQVLVFAALLFVYTALVNLIGLLPSPLGTLAVLTLIFFLSPQFFNFTHTTVGRPILWHRATMDFRLRLFCLYFLCPFAFALVFGLIFVSIAGILGALASSAGLLYLLFIVVLIGVGFCVSLLFCSLNAILIAGAYEWVDVNQEEDMGGSPTLPGEYTPDDVSETPSDTASETVNKSPVSTEATKASVDTKIGEDAGVDTTSLEETPEPKTPGKNSPETS